ncbi:PIHD2 protein, partial [Brachypteracias leptosomus]|nr:PIHD2 protein [Brachypteracias leptosomus]
ARCQATAAPTMALARAAQLWSLLDEMAENDPRAYHRFLRQQRDEAERFYALPEPRLCLRARPEVGARGFGYEGGPGDGEAGGAQPRLGLLQGAVEVPLFINICSWKRIPAPQAPSEPTPVSAGPLEEGSGEGALYRVIDVAYNPDVLQKAEENPEIMKHLIHLTLKFVEGRCNLPLSHLYTIQPFKLKGSLEMMQKRLRGKIPAPHPSQSTKKELTLAQLLHPREDEAPVVLGEEPGPQFGVQLIEEMTSTEEAEQLSTPDYEMLTLMDSNEKPTQLELRIQLPKVSSVSECELSISKDDLIIEVPGKYKLQLDLPQLVDEETTTATFNRGKRVLIITLPVAKPEP